MDPLVALVESVRAIPYGRPVDRSVDGMLRERRGTCTAKHLHLARELARRFPETEPEIVHRVYRIDRSAARERFGDAAAAAVPEEGLVDVHRYVRANVGGRRIDLDVTFPGQKAWDGHSPMPLACGPGEDLPVGDEDPDERKRELEREHCDPAAREPFIAAL
jgi:hypothetical protein